MSPLRRLFTNQYGFTAVEYAVIATVIAVAAATVMSMVNYRL